MCDQRMLTRSLGEVADTNIEALPANTPSDFRFRYIDLGAVERGFINWDRVTEGVFRTAPSRARRVVRSLDVLFGTVRPNLQPHAFVNADESGPLIASTGFSVIRARDGVSHPGYVYHSVMSADLTAQAVRCAIGSSYPAVNDADVRRFQIFLPPFLEQQQVAQILDILDASINETGAIIKKLRAVKQGLLHDLLTRGVDANGELRPPQAEAPHLYKQSPLGWIPKEWEVRRGAEVCSEIVVGIVIRPTQYYRDQGIPVLRSANVRETGLEMADLVYMSEVDHRSLGKSAVRPGDVLTVRTGYPGTSCVVDASVGEANCVDIIISRPTKSLFPPYWATWINSDRGKKQVLAVQGGLAQQHFNVGDLENLLVPVPSLHEQVLLLSYLGALNERIEAEFEFRAALVACKSGLMDDLLTGRVRVTPLLTEPQQ